MDLLDIKPFEICSIRPPTENSSLTFRLARNCYWNGCRFCPVYKLGSKFSKRSIDEVREDVRRAKAIDDLLFDRGIGHPFYSESDFPRAASLAEEISRAKWEAGMIDDDCDGETLLPRPIDPRLEWFLSWFKDRPTIEDGINNILGWRIAGGKTCFLGDSDSLIFKPDFIAESVDYIKSRFPSIARFTVYGKTRTAARTRSPAELRAFRKAGIDRVHFGLESGCDGVLSMMNKGSNAEDHVTGCLRIKEAGISCSVYVMPGLGGSALSGDHAEETVRVLNAAGPDFIRLRTLEVFAGTPLEEDTRDGRFIEASEEQAVREIRTMVEGISCETELASDSASNLIPVFGKLPADRKAMLGIIDSYLCLSPREKLEYSLESRLSSFLGQYGSLSGDLVKALSPMIKNGRIDTSAVPDAELGEIIKKIRAKLMP
ncbi:MAG: radical SAM protein [Spirochaetes bacterium]|jgi:radical SAM superfamily enzyme YgiQ (UPF0313 family)|nr:radical SAM protein [Spirochaetota bacterium]